MLGEAGNVWEDEFPLGILAHESGSLDGTGRGGGLATPAGIQLLHRYRGEGSRPGSGSRLVRGRRRHRAAATPGCGGGDGGRAAAPAAAGGPLVLRVGAAGPGGRRRLSGWPQSVPRPRLPGSGMQWRPLKSALVPVAEADSD